MIRNRAILLAAIASALAALALSPLARAGDDEDAEKTWKLDLLPKAEKDQEERLVYQATLEQAGTEGDPLKTNVSLALRRTIVAVEDGLPSRESLKVEKVAVGGVAYAQTMTFPIDRTSNKARRATVEAGGPEIPDGIAPELLAVLRRDPDGLARALAPKAAVKRGEEWQPEPKALLLLFGPPRAKLAGEDSKTKARLESVRTKDGATLAEISLEATIHYKPRGEDEVVRLKITASVKGAIDGSAPPAKEDVTLFVKRDDDSKQTISAKLERSRVDPDADEKEDGKKPGEKKDEKKGEKTEKPDKGEKTERGE